MKIKQFIPITITLETREEAEALWMIIRSGALVDGPSPTITSARRVLYAKLHNWFSNESRL